MSETATLPTQTLDDASRARLRALARPGLSPTLFVKSVSPFEVAAIVVLLFLVVGIVLVYSFYVLPTQVRHLQLSSAFDANKAKIEELQAQVANPEEINREFEAVKTSLDEFRYNYLKPRQDGRLQIIDTVRVLTNETGVRLASPVTFETSGIDEVATAESSAGRARESKKGEVSAYPSLRVGFSIAGTYQQLRTFINRFERSAQFVVIDGITLSQGEEGGSGREAPDVVTLSIGMAAYFQPAILAPPPPPPAPVE